GLCPEPLRASTTPLSPLGGRGPGVRGIPGAPASDPPHPRGPSPTEGRGGTEPTRRSVVRRDRTRSAARKTTAAAVSPSSHHGGPGGLASQRSKTTRPFASVRAGVVTAQNERPSGVKV